MKLIFDFIHFKRPHENIWKRWIFIIISSIASPPMDSWIMWNRQLRIRPRNNSSIEFHSWPHLATFIDQFIRETPRRFALVFISFSWLNLSTQSSCERTNLKCNIQTSNSTHGICLMQKRISALLIRKIEIHQWLFLKPSRSQRSDLVSTDVWCACVCRLCFLRCHQFHHSV